jgi:hypothetical protein
MSPEERAIMIPDGQIGASGAQTITESSRNIVLISYSSVRRLLV